MQLKSKIVENNVVTAVITVPWDETGDIEALNDDASELITGSCCGLEDIGYKLAGTENQEILLEVTARLSDYEENLSWVPGRGANPRYVCLLSFLIVRKEGPEHIVRYSTDEFYDENGENHG